MSEQETKQGESNSQGDQIDYKAELEKMKQENDGLKKSVEDLRLEFMSDDYLEFVNTKSAKSEEKPEVKTPEVSDDEFSKLTSKQIYERAVREAEARAEAKLKALEQSRELSEKERIASEVEAFKRSHADFNDYRHIMSGFANDPKYAKHTLSELYDEAKSYVKRLHLGATEQEKERSRKSQGEKPGSSSSSFKASGLSLIHI